MAPFQTEPYWEAELKRMLDDQKPEDAHLDYKGTESLLPPGRGGGGLDKQKRAESGISHIGSLQAQRAIQTRWWHHSQVLQGQSNSGLSNKGCDSRREPCFLSVFVVFRSPANGVKAH